MAFPRPIPGLVIRYAFLWRDEAARGQEEGVKDRPCAIVLTTQGDEGAPVVIVLPVTHRPPSDATLAVEIPASTKHRLGLDDARSWIVLTDANRFVWPGPDLRPRKLGDAASVVYGQLPDALFRQVRDRFSEAIARRLAATVPRTD